MSFFQHIPPEEQQAKWFLLWKQIIEKRMLAPNPKQSPLLITLNESDANIASPYHWKTLKHFTEYAFLYAQNTKEIFKDIAKKITPNEQNTDEIIDDMLAELKAIFVLKVFEFSDIIYHRENSVDFTAKLNEKLMGVEITHLRGPSFKEQKIYSQSNIEGLGPVYKLDIETLIKHLRYSYQNKEAHVLKHRYTSSTSIIIIFTSRQEADLLSFGPAQQDVREFLDSCKIPALIFYPGLMLCMSKSLEEILKPFDRNKYLELAHGIDAKTAVDRAAETQSKLEKVFWNAYRSA